MSSNSAEHKIESEVFRRLLDHLRSNNNVQNIDLMNLAGFVGTVYLNGMLRLQKIMVRS